MITRDEALRIQKKRSIKSLSIFIFSLIFLLFSYIILIKYVGRTFEMILFYIFVELVIAIFLYNKTHFNQFIYPKEITAKIIENELVQISQKAMPGANGPVATYSQTHSNQFKMTLIDKKNYKFIRYFPYNVSLYNFKKGDEIIILRFLNQPIKI